MDLDVHPDADISYICNTFVAEHDQFTSLTFGRRKRFPLIECADLAAGTDRLQWLSGGPGAHMEGVRPWYSFSHAQHHYSAFWSLETQRRLDEAQVKRAKWEERRRREEGG